MKTKTQDISEHPCPSCDQGKLQRVSIDFVATLPDGKELIVPRLSCEQCDACGERSFDKAARQRIDAAIVKAIGSLTSDQVERLVEMTGLREDDLCESLGLGAKTIYRWRRGSQRPSKSLGILLGVVAHHPDLLEWIENEEWKKVPAETKRSSRSAERISSVHGSRQLFSAFAIETPRTSRRMVLTPTDRTSRVAETPAEFARAVDNPVHEFFALAGASYARN